MAGCTPASHEPVLLHEAVNGLQVALGDRFIDATFGRGGHSREILAMLRPGAELLVLDRDPDAIKEAQAVASRDPRVHVAHVPFSEIGRVASEMGWSQTVAGILFDLGVSSPQIDSAERGFSFQLDGPLDMRMNPASGLSAAQWINSVPESELANVIYRFGEERYSRRIAKKIVQARQQASIETTGSLAEIVKQAHPKWEKSKHPATRTFQAIRIFINNELDQIRAALEQSVDLLATGGRLAVISFHSLEDRIVKQFFARQCRGDDLPRDLPVTSEHLQPRLKRVGKAIRPGAREVEQNPRARSAILRVVEKLR